ncbi:hypothetical protein [Lactobacillus delbrueckii]|uniref:hypothetical protein n=1 Tax=Lactobacillus delbrueckii TaxID=1584 RepID=UPI001E38701E|nr:hypothetical protein [Lactobacillus delbrueckii]MCD5457810.1 hypothetical protein [Lactobacillus delbrueckii subsp. bulgaricus]MCD9225860.1 hypothetical protein [Lactobacillus delbrueckii subsp. bulgaricus]
MPSPGRSARKRVADLREENQLHRVYKEVDPSAGEFDEYPHRFYATFETENESDATAGPRALIVGDDCPRTKAPPVPGG